MFTNTVSNKSFYSPKMSRGAFFSKRVKYWVGTYHGFGIDAEMYEVKVRDAGKSGVDFVVKDDLIDYRTNRVMCEAGTYRINVHDIEQKGHWATLNPKHGEQIFVAMHDCMKIK
jgi:hypothetical protein